MKELEPIQQEVLKYIIGPSLNFDYDTLVKDIQHVLKMEVEGDVVEFGCYKGNSSRAMLAALRYFESDKQLWVYDSFEGLPAPDKEKGDGYSEGDLACTIEDFTKDFDRFGMEHPKITKGWFNQLTENQLPHRIAYAFLDGDNYQSIKDCLELIWNKIPPWGMIAVHDYFNRNLKGVKKAVDEYIADKNCRVFRCIKDDDAGNDLITIQKYNW